MEDHLTKGSNWKKVTDIRSVAGLKVRIQLPFVSTKPDESVRDEQAGLLLGAENVEGSENNPGNVFFFTEFLDQLCLLQF